MRRNNRALYESIMRDVSKIVKKHLNESSMDKSDISDIVSILFNSGEHSGFRKGCSRYIISLADLKDRIREAYYNKYDRVLDELYDKVAENAVEDEVLCIFGIGYDATTGIVVFTSTDPYTFVVAKYGRFVSDVCQAETEREAAEIILDEF